MRFAERKLAKTPNYETMAPSGMSAAAIKYIRLHFFDDRLYLIFTSSIVLGFVLLVRHCRHISTLFNAGGLV